MYLQSCSKKYLLFSVDVSATNPKVGVHDYSVESHILILFHWWYIHLCNHFQKKTNTWAQFTRREDLQIRFRKNVISRQFRGIVIIEHDLRVRSSTFFSTMSLKNHCNNSNLNALRICTITIISKNSALFSFWAVSLAIIRRTGR